MVMVKSFQSLHDLQHNNSSANLVEDLDEEIALKKNGGKNEKELTSIRIQKIKDKMKKHKQKLYEKEESKQEDG